MIDTLNIGKYIRSVLTADNELAKYIEKKVYPLVADNDVKYPFIVYKRLSLMSNSGKDGYYEDDVTIEITIVSDKYSSGIQVANIVRSILERREIRLDNMTIYDGTLVLATEEYANNAYIQKMQFSFKINN